MLISSEIMRNLADVVLKALILLKLLTYGTSEYWPSTIVQFALPEKASECGEGKLSCLLILRARKSRSKTINLEAK